MLYDFSSLKNDVKVHSKSNKQKLEEKIFFGWRLEGHCRRGQDPDPDPDPLVGGMDYQKVTDTKH
jgi:hypothetical protein